MLEATSVSVSVDLDTQEVILTSGDFDNILVKVGPSSEMGHLISQALLPNTIHTSLYKSFTMIV